MRHEENLTVDREVANQQLAIRGGKPVRTKALPLEFPGVHHMGKEEIEAVTRLLRSRSLFRYYGIDLQEEVEAFEAEFADYLGVTYAVAVSSGTGALNVALSALGVGPGQEVIIPAYLWVSVAAAVVNHGAIPVLADIDDTFCLDPKSVEASITSRTAGIIVVHMSGAPADVKAIQQVARRHKLFLLEDCAQRNGGSVDGQRVGTFGDVAAFSFQMNKNMTSGEGGCVVTNDLGLYRRAFACHDLGYARDDQGHLAFSDPDLCLWGKGYRLDELRGALLRVQLRKLPQIINNMRRSKCRIREALKRLSEIRLRRMVDPAGDTGCFLITTYADPETAKRVNEALRAEGIVTSPQGVSNVVMTEWGLHLYYNIPSLVKRTSVDGHGFPWSLQENAGSRTQYAKGTCPVADGLFERSIILAIPSSLTEQDEDDIIQAFEKVYRALLWR
ncbi:MAG: DegT/DnrJ/EryC1/StrS family aminotransferase [Acidobacteria bacterium]|nr:DegT/DnrJ/EryC1/StrS family aminotransferase [Acidobacteriota bacterium]